MVQNFARAMPFHLHRKTPSPPVKELICLTIDFLQDQAVPLNISYPPSRLRDKQGSRHRATVGKIFRPRQIFHVPLQYAHAYYYGRWVILLFPFVNALSKARFSLLSSFCHRLASAIVTRSSKPHLTPCFQGACRSIRRRPYFPRSKTDKSSIWEYPCIGPFHGPNPFGVSSGASSRKEGIARGAE